MYWEASASHHFFTTNRGITAIRKSIYRPCYCFRAQICKYTYFSIVISNVFINSTKYEICIEWPYIIPSCLLCPVFPSLLKSKYSRYSTLFITQYGAGDELQHHQHFGLGKNNSLRDAIKRNYLDREIVPIPSDTPTIETISEYLDSEYWSIFFSPPHLLV